VNFADGCLYQLGWQFSRRVQRWVLGPGRASSNALPWLHAYLSAAHDGDAASMLMSECSRYLALVQIAAIAGCLPQGRLELVELATDALGRAGVALHRQEKGPPPVSTWRLRLVADAVRRGLRIDEQRETHSDSLHVMSMSEYIALFDEFQISQSGMMFWSWVVDPRLSDPSVLLHRDKPPGSSMLASSPTVRLQILEGLGEFVSLIECCFALLNSLEDEPLLQRACWWFHGGIYGDQQAASLVLSCMDLLIDSCAEGHDASEDRGVTLSITKDNLERLQSIRTAWERLTTVSDWIGSTRGATWDDFLDGLSEVHSFSASASAPAARNSVPLKDRRDGLLRPIHRR